MLSRTWCVRLYEAFDFITTTLTEFFFERENDRNMFNAFFPW